MMIKTDTGIITIAVEHHLAGLTMGFSCHFQRFHESASKPASQQASKPASQQASKPASHLVASPGNASCSGRTVADAM
ncbi:hypothetical protein [Escherichia coli]|uniref:hypothetical protein n=1 Tax=Escherichia coli TaxID=562 RepID=UPI003D160D88